MLCSCVFFEFVQAEGTARVHFLNASLDAFEYAGVFSNLPKLLIGGSVLDDQFGLAIDGKDHWLARLLYLINKFGCILFEISQSPAAGLARTASPGIAASFVRNR
jgi:hypothetical protein